MNDYDLIRRCDVLEILDNEGSLGRTRKLVEQLVAVTTEAQAAEIERLRGDLATCEKYRDAYAVMERIGAGNVRDREAKLEMVEARMDAGFAEYERRLVKAVEALRHAKLNMPHPDQLIDDTLAELTGGKDD